jgi:hypothetical protein
MRHGDLLGGGQVRGEKRAQYIECRPGFEFDDEDPDALGELLDGSATDLLTAWNEGLCTAEAEDRERRTGEKGAA